MAKSKFQDTLYHAAYCAKRQVRQERLAAEHPELAKDWVNCCDRLSYYEGLLEDIKEIPTFSLSDVTRWLFNSQKLPPGWTAEQLVRHPINVPLSLSSYHKDGDVMSAGNGKEDHLIFRVYCTGDRPLDRVVFTRTESKPTGYWRHEPEKSPFVKAKILANGYMMPFGGRINHNGETIMKYAEAWVFDHSDPRAVLYHEWLIKYMVHVS